MKRQRQTPRGRARGFTLIEELVAIVLMSFGLLGLVSLQARAVQYSVSAEDSQRAALLANEIATRMWGANTVTLDQTTVIDPWAARVADAAASGLPNGVGTVTVAGNVARIVVQWRPPRAAVGDENRYQTDVVIP